MWTLRGGQAKGNRVKVVPFVNAKLKYDAELEQKVGLRSLHVHAPRS